ncbi:hypothetical protein [Paraliobacillus ryukyuensis]|uniref:hypothetical protein n=1 Tax=Paraliobacillus ryukyuensis TaxID=200904 RepID=UPI0009A870E3|nr:hypothetical protein [Paraliobacillus ryukyuensis]
MLGLFASYVFVQIYNIFDDTWFFLAIFIIANGILYISIGGTLGIVDITNKRIKKASNMLYLHITAQKIGLAARTHQGLYNYFHFVVPKTGFLSAIT